MSITLCVRHRRIYLEISKIEKERNEGKNEKELS